MVEKLLKFLLWVIKTVSEALVFYSHVRNFIFIQNQQL